MMIFSLPRSSIRERSSTLSRASLQEASTLSRSSTLRGVPGCTLSESGFVGPFFDSSSKTRVEVLRRKLLRLDLTITKSPTRLHEHGYSNVICL